MAETATAIELICFPGAANLPIFESLEKGTFEEAGVAVNLTTTPSSAYRAEHMIAGTFRIAATAFDNVVAYGEGQGAFKPETDYVPGPPLTDPGRYIDLAYYNQVAGS